MSDNYSSEPEYNSNFEIDGGGSYKSQFSKPELCQRHIERILSLRSKQMRPGYTTWVMDKQGNLKPTIMADARAEFIGSVDALIALLMPEIELKKEDYRKDYAELFEKFKKDKEEIFDKYCYYERISRYFDEEKNKVFWNYTGKKWMPEIGEAIPVADSEHSLKIHPEPNAWDGKVNAYIRELVEIYTEFFAELNCLLDDNFYFAE